jgi:hypothetical protein
VHGLIVAAGAVSIVGTAAALAALVYLHVAPTGLSPIRNPVSQYGISSHRGWYRVLTISMGVAGASLAVGLGEALRGQRVGIVVGLLSAFAVCRLAISWFPMDVPGSPRTSTGALHGVLAIVTFLAAAIGAIRLCKVLDAGTRFASLSNLSRGLGWAMVVCFALLFFSRLSPELRRVFGAVERLLYVAILVWLSVFAVACVSLRG